VLRSAETRRLIIERASRHLISRCPKTGCVIKPATPFRHMGSNERGLDCRGLVELAGTEAGVLEVDRRLAARFLPYARQPHLRQIVKACEAFLVPIDLETAAPGDVLLLRTHQKEPQHLALLAPFDTIIHASESGGGVIEGQLGPWRRGRLIDSAWQYPGLAARLREESPN
jgi:cell wall-associated NlpC family hydrolase